MRRPISVVGQWWPAALALLLACGGEESWSGGGGGAGGSVVPPGLDGWPLAIPEPDFGVKEEVPAPPADWTMEVDGSYYVDNTHPAATDDANPLGTPDKPRLTIPTDLPAGAVVYLAGGPYDAALTITAAGSSAAPVFITAADPDAPPVLSRDVELGGSYLVVERLDFYGPDSGVRVLTPSDHIAVRDSEIHGGQGGPSSGLYTGRWNPEDDPATAEQVVFYRNQIHDNGDWHANFDEDHHGIAIGHHAAYVWVVGNVMFHNSGDGLQINAKKAGLIDTLHHVFVGRNLAYENKQTGLWSKQSSDVIFSDNVIHAHRASDSSGGACIGFQYGPERLWILFNELYDCEAGISSSTYQGDVDGVPGPGQDIYLIGNVIHDIHKQDGSGPSTDPWQTGAAIRFTDQQATKHVLFNTVHEVDVAITYARGTGGLELDDNLLAGVLGAQLRIETSEAAATSSIAHTLFSETAVIDWGDHGGYDVAAFQSAFSGQCAGCVEADPAFVDPAGGDLHLQAASPAVDAGAASAIGATFSALYGTSLDLDADGVSRPQGGGVDIGAYER